VYWTEKERQELWERDQVRFAEISHNYLCCDVPTITKCILCTHNPKQCLNRKEAEKAIRNYKEWGLPRSGYHFVNVNKMIKGDRK